MSKYHAVSSGMVTRQALPSITRQRGTTTGSANLMLYGAGKTTVSNNTTFIDSSTNNFTVTRNGDTVQSGFNPFSQASSGSGYFDGNGDYLRTPSNAALSLSGSDFTIEGWIYLTSYSPGYSGIYASALCGAANGGTSSGYQLTAIGTASSYTGINFYARSGGFSQVDITATQSLSLNTWYHIAVTKSGTTYRIFIGGVAVNTTTSSATWTDTGVLDIGQSGFPGYQYTMPGYISNFRVVKGTAVYTSNFTPPTSPLTAITNTSLLLLTDNYSIVNSTATSLPISIFGGATISTTQSPTGMTSSMYFNSATSSYVQTPTNTTLNLSSGNYTVEGWYYLDMATYSSFDLGGRGIVSDYLTNSNGRWLISIGGTGKLEFTEQDAIGQNSATVTDPSNSPLQQWVYFAAVKSGTTMYLFKNGTSVGSTTSAVRTGFPGRLNVGQSTVDTNYRAFFLGYISNIRVSKGTAIYTSNFTTPSAPLSLSVSVPNFVTNNIYGLNQIP
jgi:hypothetical protein